MEKITGKTIVFSDLHLGLKSGSKTRLAICARAISEIVCFAKQNQIRNCLFLGDWHHVRMSTENSVLNVSHKLMTALAKTCRVYCLLGNHDIYMKSSADVNSLVFFSDIPNVELVSEATEVELNGERALLVPWLGDVARWQPETFHYLFGHFDVSDKFLIQSYAEEHAAKQTTGETVKKELSRDDMLAGTSSSQAAEKVGSFIDLAARGGLVMSGHIHKRAEMVSKGREFVIVGDPFQQNLGERHNSCGFYVVDETGKHEFHELISLPRHVDLKMSQFVDGADFDFSCCSGNIVHKTYDVDVDPKLDAEISRKICAAQPLEELPPDYAVDVSKNSQLSASSVEA